MSDELKPCPFCGSKNISAYARTCNKDSKYNPADRAFPIVRCLECGSCAEGRDWGEPITAITKWNSRTQPPCGTDGAALAALVTRDLCESEPANPDDPDTVCVKVNYVAEVIQRHAKPAAPVAPATVAVPDDVMAALDRMCTSLHESILKGATAASDAASMKVIRDYILATHPQGVRAVPGEYVLVPVNPTREMISAGDAANDGIVSDIYRAMVSQVVKESFTTAVPRVPFSMPDAAVERIYDAAGRAYRRFKSGVRGQIVTQADGYEWHVINATLDEVRAMLAASQREGGGT